MIPDTPEQLHHKEASELQSNVSGTDSGGQQNTALSQKHCSGFQEFTTFLPNRCVWYLQP